MGGLISGILGGGSSAGQEAQLAEMAKAREAIQQYRPEAMNARINAMKNAQGAYQGANNALETMYGGGSGPSLSPTAKIEGALAGTRPKRFMGHDLPTAPMAPTPGVGGQPRPQGHPGKPPPDAADAAFMMLDPLNIFGAY